MEEIIIPSNLRMQLPDQLAYELDLIKTPEKIERNKINAYILIGVIGTLIAGITIYFIYENYQKKIKRKQILPQS